MTKAGTEKGMIYEEYTYSYDFPHMKNSSLHKSNYIKTLLHFKSGLLASVKISKPVSKNKLSLRYRDMATIKTNDD